jgi:hypothetical protein
MLFLAALRRIPFASRSFLALRNCSDEPTITKVFSISRKPTITKVFSISRKHGQGSVLLDSGHGSGLLDSGAANIVPPHQRITLDPPQNVPVERVVFDLEVLRELKTQKKKKDYVRDILKKIGMCKSVISVSQAYYNSIYNLVLNHPEADEKLAGVVDFSIKLNKTQKNGIALWIINQDPNPLDVSWVCCAIGEGKQLKISFLDALRTSIADQIQDYRARPDTDTTRCTICLKQHLTSCHVDHIIPFKTLVQRFIAMQPQQPFKYPTAFTECNDGTGQYRLADTAMEKAFQQLHKKEAELRITCAPCNMSRTD